MTASHTAFVAVGANIDPEKNIEAALRSLMGSVTVESTSTFYKTRPLEREDQPMFFNGVWKLLSHLRPKKLKYDVLRRIEDSLGRVRTSDVHAARPIDLDLIMYDDEIINEPDLCIPDQQIKTRPFIAVPLFELCPDLVLPGSGEALSSLPIVRNKEGLEVLTAFSKKLERIIKQ